MSEETHARQLVIFTLGTEEYALPIKKVQEIIRYIEPRSVASNDSSVRGVISLRGKIVPVYDLAGRLGVDSVVSEESKIVIVETAEQTVGIVVDGVDEVMTIEEDQLEQVPGADATLMDSIAKIDDRLVVLLNPDTIFDTTPAGGLKPCSEAVIVASAQRVERRYPIAGERWSANSGPTGTATTALAYGHRPRPMSSVRRQPGQPGGHG